MKLRKISIIAVSFASLNAFAGPEDLYFGAVKNDRWIYTQSDLISEKPITGEATRGAVLKGQLEMEVQAVVIEDKYFLESDRFHYVDTAPIKLRFSETEAHFIQRMVPSKTSAIFFTKGRTNITQHRLEKFRLRVARKGHVDFYWSEELAPEHLSLQSIGESPAFIYLSEDVRRELIEAIRLVGISALSVNVRLDLYGSDSNSSRLSVDLESAEARSFLGLKLTRLERLKQACDKILSPPSR